MLQAVRRAVLAVGVVLAAGAARGEDVEMAHFHHVHLNVVDPQATIEFYQQMFSAVPVKFRDVSDALLTDRSFILLTKVAEPAPSALDNTIYHIGWGGVDGLSDYRWRADLGVPFETPVTPLGKNFFMYLWGPDKELVEVWTGFKHHRFGHVHLLATDVNATAKWYMDNLGLEGPDRDIPKPPEPPEKVTRGPGGQGYMPYIWGSAVRTKDSAVTINIFGKPSTKRHGWWNYDPVVDMPPTEGHVIDHLAFSYPNIDPVYRRMKKAGVEIVEPIKRRDEYNMRSFFVRGPDNLLIEIVEGRPLPDGVWQKR